MAKGRKKKTALNRAAAAKQRQKRARTHLIAHDAELINLTMKQALTAAGEVLMSEFDFNEVQIGKFAELVVGKMKVATVEAKAKFSS